MYGSQSIHAWLPYISFCFLFSDFSNVYHLACVWPTALVDDLFVCLFVCLFFSMSKLDMRNYLQSIYKVKVAKVNTRIQQGATHITQLQELNQHFVWKQCLVQDSRNKESFESQSKLFITICKVSWVLVNSDHLTFTLLHFNTLYCICIFCYITNYLSSKLNYEWYPKSILLFSLSFPIARNTCTSTLLSECFVLLYNLHIEHITWNPHTHAEA